MGVHTIRVCWFMLDGFSLVCCIFDILCVRAAERLAISSSTPIVVNVATDPLASTELVVWLVIATCKFRSIEPHTSQTIRYHSPLTLRRLFLGTAVSVARMLNQIDLVVEPLAAHLALEHVLAGRMAEVHMHRQIFDVPELAATVHAPHSICVWWHCASSLGGFGWWVGQFVVGSGCNLVTNWAERTTSSVAKAMREQSDSDAQTTRNRSAPIQCVVQWVVRAK